MRNLIVLVGRDKQDFENFAKDLKLDLRLLDRDTDIPCLVDSLEDFNRIIIVATLGSWQGEVMIELALKCKCEVIFYCLTKTKNIHEMIASRIQVDEILKIFPNFQGVIISEELPLEVRMEALRALISSDEEPSKKSDCFHV